MIEPVYVFAVVPADHPCRLDELAGAGSWPGLRRMPAGATAAVLGAAPERLRAKQRDLLRHQRVIDHLWAMGPVLPMRFGFLAPSREQLHAELVRDADRHLDALARVTGRAEVNVKVLPAEQSLLAAVAATDPTVRRLRERGARTYLERLRLGEAVAAAVQALAGADAELVRRTLGPLAEREAAGPEVAGCALNTSFLVETGRLDGFLALVAELGRRLADRCQVRGFGPMPPYSFSG